MHITINYVIIWIIFCFYIFVIFNLNQIEFLIIYNIKKFWTISYHIWTFVLIHKNIFFNNFVFKIKFVELF